MHAPHILPPPPPPPSSSAPRRRLTSHPPSSRRPIRWGIAAGAATILFAILLASGQLLFDVLGQTHPCDTTHRRIRSDEHRTHRGLQSSLGTEGHSPGNRHPQLERDNWDIELAWNRKRWNPAARHVNRRPAPFLPFWSAAERQPTARTRKPA